MEFLKLVLNAVVAWTAGIAVIATMLYFGNDGADFTFTDISGFGVLAIVISALLMLFLYVPSLYWLKRRRGGMRPRLEFLLLTGIVCNVPLIVILFTLVNRKMTFTEAVGFIVTFFVIGSVFGFGFTLTSHNTKRGNVTDLRR
jgi:hypothetical protein